MYSKSDSIYVPKVWWCYKMDTDSQNHTCKHCQSRNSQP